MYSEAYCICQKTILIIVYWKYFKTVVLIIILEETGITFFKILWWIEN